MADKADTTIEHEAHLGTGNGLVQFVCCGRTDQPFDALWVGPGGRRPANIFHTPRQAYDLVVNHLTKGEPHDAIRPVLHAAERLVTQVETSEPWMSPTDDVRPSIQYLAEHLDTVDLTVAHN